MPSFSTLSRIICLVALHKLLTGCATTSDVPKLITTKPAEEISVARVQENPRTYIGKQVRWGGAIIGVENFKQHTLIELLSRKLSTNGKPTYRGSSEGRFMVTVKGFIDPEEYPKERLMTVTGMISKVIEKKVGDYPYVYPMVEAEAYYLWSEKLGDPYPYHYRPFYYDPWYAPWPYSRYRYPFYY